MNNAPFLVNIYAYGHASYKGHNDETGYDVALSKMEKDAVARVINLKNPKIAEKLIFLALEHFGPDFSLWVNHNVRRNAFLQDDNVEAIHQILDFIKTGKFKYSVYSLKCMLKAGTHKRYSISPARLHYDYSKTELPIYTVDIIKMILSRSEEGIFHLLDIMNLLFGRPDAITDTVSVKVLY